MLRIITHIERLLLTHDCVILPKFGGFVLQTLPATYQEEEHLFRPMRKEVMFNVTLQHTDGLLSESYMQTYGVDYRKAQLMLEEDIEALNVSLEQDKRITLGRIGTFSIGEEGQTIFTPGDSGVFNADSYGLPSFHFPVLRSLGCGRISQHQWPNPVHSGPSLTKGRTVEEEKTAPATKRRQVIKKSLIFRSGFFING